MPKEDLKEFNPGFFNNKPELANPIVNPDGFADALKNIEQRNPEEQGGEPPAKRPRL